MKYQFAVFGDPIGHSKSPDIHRRFGEQLSLSVTYNKVNVKERDFESEVTRFFTDGGDGLSVTVPHKWAAFQMASSLSDEALLAGACNTLMPLNGGLYGHNTDGLGLLDDLERLGWSPTDQRVLILGAGGAVAGCLGPLLATNPSEIVIANRSIDKLESLVGRYERGVRGIPLSELDSQGAPFDLVLNGISAGLSGSTGVELTDRIVNADGACYDLVYGVDDTPFLKMCCSLTDQRADGLGMLLAQAARQFELWTGIYPEPFEQLVDFGRAPDGGAF
ncbi:MAG: Shikimate dehydrogenase (NADP(+)) [Gammaproteobacteria bacterium]|nr:MAG: Shikimate dehydrogenase (NADP(+)) [Gammaproteobacteria bacterium]